MQTLTNILVSIVAIQHAGFLTLEMFFWQKPLGRKISRQTVEHARISAPLAANQGLYNGFLAAGLFWGLVHPQADFGLQIKLYFLVCVVIAGAYGAYSVSHRILWVQALPAFVALVLLWWQKII